MPRIYKKIAPITRFMSMVDMNGPIHPEFGQCWIWTGARLPFKLDYGVFTIGRREGMRRAHRFIWEATYGVIPDGLQVLHRCDRAHCVNPQHLFLGTQQDNMDDMNQKGRGACGDDVASKGEDNPKAKLTDEDVKEIRRLRPVMSLTQLANRFNVHVCTIKRIMNGRRWRHI